MMILWLAGLAVLILYRTRIVAFNGAYLDKSTADPIKGIFIFIVLLSHMREYISPGGGVLNSLYAAFFSMIGQLMVAMFLFYSGYGCYKSFQHKENYFKGFLKKRVLKTLVNFAAALLLYVIVNLIFRFHYSAKEYLLCWIGWESIGNSNWYIFTILALYCMTWLGFAIERKTAARLSVPIVSLLCVAYIYFMHAAGKESWWYDTSLCYPLGMMVSACKETLSQQLKSTAKWLGWLAASLAAFLVCYKIGSLFSFFAACFFCLVVVILTAKLRIGNRPLSWMGKHLFEIYILQRLPMILLSWFQVIDPMLFSALAICATMLLAGVFQLFLIKLDAKLFPR